MQRDRGRRRACLVLATGMAGLCGWAWTDTLVGARHTMVASAFGPGLYGNTQYCGAVLRPSTLGVAHKSWPCGTRVTITYKGRSVTVRVTDRGPFIRGRDLDLTAATARALCGCSPTAWGVRRVEVTR